MKLNDLEQRCGICKIIDFCAGPFEELCLCTDSRLANITENEYIKLANNSYKSTNQEICEDIVGKIERNAK